MAEQIKTFEDAVAAVPTLTRIRATTPNWPSTGSTSRPPRGDVTGKRPGFTNPVGRAKYDAWAAVEGTSAEDAEADHIAKVRALPAAEK